MVQVAGGAGWNGTEDDRERKPGTLCSFARACVWVSPWCQARPYLGQCNPSWVGMCLCRELGHVREGFLEKGRGWQ